MNEISLISKINKLKYFLEKIEIHIFIILKEISQFTSLISVLKDWCNTEWLQQFDFEGLLISWLPECKGIGLALCIFSQGIQCFCM